MSEDLVCVTFEDNALLASLYGEQDEHLTRIEKQLDVSTSSRGNVLSISGKKQQVVLAKKAIEDLYSVLERGASIGLQDVDAAIRMAFPPRNSEQLALDSSFSGALSLQTRKKNIIPYSRSQHAYIETLQNKELVFAVGPAGTGKTYLAIAVAVSMFLARKVDRIILSRPAVEAGEKLGFLPGDLKEKIDPYLRPLYDALHDMLPAEHVSKYLETGTIEIAPLAFMRGRTLNNAFVILDEAQNTTATQMKMFLTRLGEGSRIVVTGDLSQIDLLPGITSGLKDSMEKLKDVSDIGFVSFGEEDVIRHPLTAKIVRAYNNSENNAKTPK